jgi:hypothetical protein
MKEYIERVTALNALIRALGYCQCANDVITRIPAADVAEVRHGRWNPEIHHTYIPVEYDQNGDPILHEYTSFRCSLCGREEPKEEPYCHCGARMGKEADHEVSE